MFNWIVRDVTWAICLSRLHMALGSEFGEPLVCNLQFWDE